MVVTTVVKMVVTTVEKVVEKAKHTHTHIHICIYLFIYKFHLSLGGRLRPQHQETMSSLYRKSVALSDMNFLTISDPIC